MAGLGGKRESQGERDCVKKNHQDGQILMSPNQVPEPPERPNPVYAYLDGKGTTISGFPIQSRSARNSCTLDSGCEDPFDGFSRQWLRQL